MVRPLVSNVQVTSFLEGLFGERDPIFQSSVVEAIFSTELSLKGGADENLSTLDNDDYRSRPYKTDAARWDLRNQIVEELFSQKRLKNDETICLGSGGALPDKRIQRKNQAYLITGLPASGKSGVAATVADRFGAAILDSDYAKRKLPEYNKLTFGASMIHEESGAIVFGHPYFNNTPFKTLLDRFSEKGTNIVLPKIGDKVDSVLKLVAQLKNYEYAVHLMTINMDRKLATKRAVNRFKDTGRYVPLSLIYDVYANEPILTYYQLKQFHSAEFKSMGSISTKDRPAQYLEDTGEGSPALLFRKKL